MRSSFKSILSFYPWIVVCCGIFFYCYNYFLRVSPSVMQNQLALNFHLNATEFGALAGLYYLAYTIMQIPAGMIYDKFGVRFVLSMACATATLGTYLFIATDTLFIAQLGRFIMGLGCAFAFIGTMKLASIWLPMNRFATVAGLTTAIGMVSGAMTQKHLTSFIEQTSYQQALHGAFLIGIVLSVLIFMTVRSRPRLNIETDPLQEPMTIRQLIQTLRIIFCNPQMWLIGLIGSLLYLPSSVFLDLWGIPYLKTVYQFSADEAATIARAIFYGWIVSGPIVGLISDRIKRRKLPLLISSISAACLLYLAFYLPNQTASQLYTLFFLVGFCCGGQSLCFALGKETNSIHLSGTAVAVTNMLIMAGGAIFQPVVGKLLDLHTTSPLGADGLPIYTASDYSFALAIIPIGVMLSILLTLFVKETHCGSTPDEVIDNKGVETA